MIKRDLVFVKHILDAIGDIQFSIKNLSKKEFIENKDIKDATIRRLEIIGEAVKNISNDFKEKYPKVSWRKIAELRDIIIHAYFDIDLDIVWKIIKKDIPLFKNQMLKIKKELFKN